MKRIAVAFILILTLLCGTIVANAASDPAVNIVSPTESVYGTTFLVSVKITQPKTVRIAVFEQKQIINGNLVSINPNKFSSIKSDNIRSLAVTAPATVNCTDSLYFYNKQVTDITPGVYKVSVSTLNSAGGVTAVTNQVVVVRDKAPSDSVVFDQQQTVFKWLQSFFRNLFGS